jgi:cellulose synthase/poly-beta-1,6-N-acetylglucosamine synthase-like glycosyltransferase
MTDIEIPRVAERHFRYRLFEIMPWALSMSALIILILLSIINVTIAAFYILLLIFVYVTRAMAVAIRSVYGYNALRKNIRINWLKLLTELELGKCDETDKTVLPWHLEQVKTHGGDELAIKPSNLLNAVIIATYNESREVLEPTIQSVLASDYPKKQMILILAYEERGGSVVEQQAKELVETYKEQFYYAVAIKHPKNIEGEVIGKGGNISYAGREFKKYLEKNHIDPLRVIVTTLDADNRPDKEYLPCLSYTYVLCPDPVRSAFQPISMYTNNIWDAPAPMRVVATGNSIFNVVLALRPHAMRNFSSHAQGMASLIETDFWSTRTIVEDGHQFWRSYFRFDGHYIVYPLHVPIYQDAVLSDTYRKTLKAQFIQLRRWTYGASDIAYVFNQGYFKKNKVSKSDLIAKTFRLTEGHVTWAVGPILTLVGGFVPVLFHPHSLAANQLPLIISRVQTLALITIIAMLFLCLKTLPPKPERYKRRRTFFMIIQWVYLPFTTVIYNSFAAIYSQTRLAFGHYMGFDVTQKAVVDVGKSGQIKTAHKL